MFSSGFGSMGSLPLRRRSRAATMTGNCAVSRVAVLMLASREVSFAFLS
jgi:hypothetical protein